MKNEKGMMSEFAVASLVMGIASFVQFFNVEKPIVAIVFGILALKKIGTGNQLRGKKLAVIGIILAVISIIATAILTYMYWPQLQQMMQNMQ